MQMKDLLLILLALLAGGLIGVSFGLLQSLALRRHRTLQQAGKFATGWAAMPGSFRRVAWLLVALVLVELTCPLFFTAHVEWWVSGGVVSGYGAVLFWRLRHKVLDKT
jgi:hypothetical protein